MHFYTPNAETAHFQPTKKGAKNKLRPTTVADARKLGLYPSITEILKAVANPGLEAWKQRRVAEVAYGCPATQDTVEEYVGYVLDKAFDGSAASLGDRIHENLNHHYSSLFDYARPEDEYPHQEELYYVLPAARAVSDLGFVAYNSEYAAVSHDYKYGGTIDLLGAIAEQTSLIDFKSTKTEPGVPVKPRQGQAAQIAAGLVAARGQGVLRNERTTGHNVYISTTEPGRVEVVSYSQPELKREFEFFLHAFEVWKHINNYRP